MARVGEERPARPARPGRVPWDVCLRYEYDSELARYARAIVPLELVEPGDVQVVAQGRTGVGADGGEVSLDGLVVVSSVESIIIDRPVRLGRPLPQVHELMVTSGVPPPTNATLRNLPNLERLCLGRSPTRERIDWRTLAAMRNLRDLRLHAWHISTVEPIDQLRGLERLRIEDHTFESIAPLAACERLRWLAIGWWKGMDRLGSLANLEHLELNEGTLSSLRALRNLSRLRSLVVFGRRLKTLNGIDHLGQLGSVFLYDVGVEDLTPLGECHSIRRLRLDAPNKVRDFAPIGRLTDLEALIVVFKGGPSAATPRLRDLVALGNLRELALLNVDGEGWEFLVGLPKLERVRLYGAIAAGAQDVLRRRFPAAVVDVRPSRLQQPTNLVPAQLPDGAWSLREDLRDMLGVSDNFAAEERIRERLRADDPELLTRLELDSEADFLSVVGRSRDDVLRVCRLIAVMVRG